MNTYNEIRNSRGLKIVPKYISDSGVFRRASIDYRKWESYIDRHSDVFIWFKDTETAKRTLDTIDTIPQYFREDFLSMFNKVSCYSEHIKKKNFYNMSLVFHEELQHITIDFEQKMTTKNLKISKAMADHLDAVLLCDDLIIDEKMIEYFEKKHRNTSFNIFSSLRQKTTA